MEIRRLHRAEGMPVRAVARKLGVGRNTVRRALAADGPPRYQRPAKGSVADAAEPLIRELLAQWPDMPATVIAERIGWDRSLTVLKVKVRELRPLFAPPDPASRTQYLPGELAQCDLWFPLADVPLGAGQAGWPPVLVMVAGYSRVMTARMIPSRQSPDLLAGHWALISGLGAVPRPCSGQGKTPARRVAQQGPLIIREARAKARRAPTGSISGPCCGKT